MDKKVEETVLKVADYSNQEKEFITRRMHFLFIAGMVAFIVYMVLDLYHLTESQTYENIADLSLGLILGILATGVLFTSRAMSKIRAFKMRLLRRN